ncbi:MAG: LPS export ABC transporter periplasmic protein LptC [Muribaculaceae bacterium]|nr:LPS export ABC transporter periplasmic protein LptC [Bacteroides sp.]MDE5847532.1 LPS export ABC transporter periplasmic protein LptC [Muribaculaceae bacterium]MDE6192980.1 LPS export ABC transporter periplasmic protein LptC [Muribaculaceae bacterium]
MRLFSFARLSGILTAIAMLAVLGLGSCKDEGKLGVASRIDPKKMPSMTTVNVATLISDSGITQYKIVSPLWNVYDEVDTPYWSFPKGIYLQKYDRKFNVIASVAADSAKFFRLQNLWKLDGNVELKKEPGELFLTQQLFWDQRRNRLYSDSFIHIETPERMLEGHGFESNDRLTKYSIRKPTGIFPVSEDMRR